MEHAPEAIVVLDVDARRFYEVNDNAVRLFDLSREELLKVGPIELSPPFQPDGRPSAESAVEKIQAAVAGEMPVFEWVHRASDGIDIPCEVRLVRLPSSDRVLVRGSVTDISERKQAERERGLAAVERELAARARRLQRVTDAALSHLALEELLPELVKRLREVLDADNAAILLAEQNGDLVVRAASGIEPVGVRVTKDVGFAGRVVSSAQPVELHGEEFQTIPVHTAELQTLGALLGLPLLVEGRVVGVVHVGFHADRAFDRDEVNILQLAADRAALAIQHSQLYERERHIASTLQQSLLPKLLPQITNVEIESRFLPVGDGHQVGGDFYDAFGLDANRWLLVLGDVCGKGPEAAALTALARYTLRAEALHEPRPGELLGLLNDAILSQHSDLRFCTALCLLLDLRGRWPTVTVASGGHPMPLIVRADGRVEPTLDPGSPLIGVYPDAQYHEHRYRLAPGDTVVAYSDGLLEAYAPEQILDPSDLAVAARDHPTHPLAAFIRALESAALGKHTGPVRDDIAILALRIAKTGELKASSNTQPRAQDKPDKA